MLVAYGIWSGATATLQIALRHNLRAADLSVRIDGDLAFSEHLSGANRKRFGVFGQVEGSFSRSLSLSAGEHVVEVQLKSVEDGFNQTKLSRIFVPNGESTTLQVSATRNSLSLAYFGPATEAAGWSRFSGTIASALTTLVGTIATAGIGYWVQEFLRSKKLA